MFHNVVIGKPIVNPTEFFALNQQDWEENEKEITLFTNERFLPRLLVAAGIVKSTSEVRRNRPDLVKNLIDIDFIQVKWGKHFLWIMVGE